MLSFIKEHTSRTKYTVLALLLAVPTLGFWEPVNADYMKFERLRLGTSEPLANTTHNYNYNVPTTSNVGSIRFQYCQNSPLSGAPCTAPADLNVGSFIITSQTGVTGFTPHGSTNANNIVVARASSGVTSGTSATLNFSNVVNPSQLRLSVYVRILTYVSSDGSGTPIDIGAVVFSTSGQITTGGFVPPYLRFCAGVTVDPYCTNVQGSNISLGELSSSRTATGTSQFSVSTNYLNGYSVFLSGRTLTSGNNTIPPVVSGSSLVGQSQFGVNVVSNNNPSVGANPSTSGSGVGLGGYISPNTFRFASGEPLARSTTTSSPTVFTVSYIANVASTQPPGVYNTTLQYIAVAQF